MKKSVVIVAGGQGTRMGALMPKQFLLLAGVPVLMHTIRTFHHYGHLKIIVVLPEDQQEHWKQLCSEHDFTIEHVVTPGGTTRFQSVKNGLQICSKRIDSHSRWSETIRFEGVN